MLSLSRGAHAVTDLTQSGTDAVETVVEVVSEVGTEAAAAVRTHSTRLSRFFTPRRIRRLSVAALFAAAWEVYQDLRPGGHHGMVLLAAHDLVDTGTRASTRLARFLGSRWLWSRSASPSWSSSKTSSRARITASPFWLLRTA